MDNASSKSVSLGLAAIAAACATHASADPLLSVSVTVDRTAAPAGRPQIVEIAPGSPSGFAAGPAAVWSVESPFGDDWYIFDDHTLDEATAADAIFTNYFGSTLIASQQAYHFSGDITINSLSQLPSWVNAQFDADGAAIGDIGRFAQMELQGECFSFNSLLNAPFYGQPDSLTVHNCDAIDASIGFGALGVRVVGAENSANLTVTVSPVNYAFTSLDAPSRSEAFSQFGDAFLASSAADELASHLVGQVGLVAVGSLPQGGALLTFSGVLSRSAAAGDIFLPPQTAATYQLAFGFSTIEQILGYALANREATLDDFGLAGFEYQQNCLRMGPSVSGRCDALDATIGLFGVELRVLASENNPDMTFAIDRAGIHFTSTNSLDREDAVSQFSAYLEGANTDNLVSALLAALAASRPDDPLVGNPHSLQGVFNAALLNLDSPSVLLDEAEPGRDGREVDPPGWMIGGRVGALTIGEEEATFVEAVLERGWRVGEGHRSRVKVSLPFTYTDYGDDNHQSAAALRASVEFPAQQGRWVIEPAAGVGYFFETDEFGSGALWAVGVSSRYKIAPVGRGHIVIGNAVSYSSTIEIEGSGPVQTPEIQNTAFRNGVAYQTPVGDRMFGRQVTMRASYTYTTLEGDEVFLDAYHDATVSFGFGSREASVRTIHETMRVGLSGTIGDDYEAYSLNVGFRF